MTGSEEVAVEIKLNFIISYSEDVLEQVTKLVVAMQKI
jgi:hypothetical protein